MPELVIDTASDRGAVGLVEAGRNPTVLAERRWTLTTTYSKELLAQIDALLREAEVSRTAIDALVVNIGPGGYGSLRVGVATAQGLAIGLGVPLAGVLRLEADATRQLEGAPDRPVIAVHEAGRSGLAWAAYASGAPGEAPRPLVAPRLDEPAECVASAPEGALWCGEIGEALRAAWFEAGVHALEAPPEERERRLIDLARLAGQHEAYSDPALVDVLYLRPPSITRPRER